MREFNKIKDLARHFRCTEYRIERMVEKGLLERPLPRSNSSEMRLWTADQVRRAELKLKAMTLPNKAKNSKNGRVEISERMKYTLRTLAV